MKLKEEEWERIKLKMRTAGIPASQQYYDVSFEEELKLKFYPREGFEVSGLKLSEEYKKKLRELTEKVLRAVSVEGKAVIVPLKGVPYEWTAFLLYLTCPRGENKFCKGSFWQKHCDRCNRY